MTTNAKMSKSVESSSKWQVVRNWVIHRGRCPIQGIHQDRAVKKRGELPCSDESMKRMSGFLPWLNPINTGRLQHWWVHIWWWYTLHADKSDRTGEVRNTCKSTVWEVPRAHGGTGNGQEFGVPPGGEHQANIIVTSSISNNCLEEQLDKSVLLYYSPHSTRFTALCQW